MIKNIIPQLISSNQGGYIAGCQIYDNIFLVQEAILSSQKRKEVGMEIKLDLENAFDRIRHDYIYMV